MDLFKKSAKINSLMQVDSRYATRWQFFACHILGVIGRRVFPNDLLLHHGLMMIDIFLIICAKHKIKRLAKYLIKSHTLYS